MSFQIESVLMFYIALKHTFLLKLKRAAKRYFDCLLYFLSCFTACCASVYYTLICLLHYVIVFLFSCDEQLIIWLQVVF